ncbi:RmlC-like jelly roll fold protein [Akanthomyces lecanii RCEF 1005]|uniref:RmlC-like jelly roll fold protein n=1 Tax=Akanthomyces lecanii RCEF 1005 TaxID=1081108 RepID=A0A168G796_CORDF|nr:RmlC-like jelly roll fold protein [Akanthomyces lecanii RCEF 1005]
MHPGDVIITPTWSWHDHGKKGADEEGGDESPVIWLDGLDLPSFIHFPVHFNEHYSAARYPATDVDSSPIVFPWRDMLAKLHDAPGSWAAVPYRNSDGREIGRVIGASAERLDKGAESPVRQETSSSVYHVIQGSGWSEIGGKSFSWQRGDTFCIPAWYKYKHVANGEDNGVYLYRFDDKPMLKSLGLLRTQMNGTHTFASLA